eukprot:CAMPEP_0119475716 /NCGR_PEP_ID=MMETSP1344-20130328/6495_1 /TAXON_ID=236787 /ORGANISM="Florenciella parvula, Strain CCMP2471" /LENGTH=277 /DNA_ID=CAMNT_0007509301 /DNA_START=204 /DNA_END=1038 /DNA_ORIENTATION=-
MNIFGRPRNTGGGGGNQPARARQAAPDAAQAILKLRGTVETLDKREAHIGTKITAQTTEAKAKLAKKDKKGALICMKRKKMFENEITKIQGARLTLEQQMLALENAAMNMQTFGAMNEGKQALKAARGGMDADTIGDTMDDIREEMDEADAIATALGAPLDDALEDDDELLAELNMMEQDDLEDKLLNPPSVPTSTPVGAAEDILDLPDAPTSQVVVDGDVEDDELAALRELEASMMAAELPPGECRRAGAASVLGAPLRAGPRAVAGMSTRKLGAM